MIKFFRRIRQKLLTENRFSKYLLYALGEIILVVIGILIALQINNWNEQKKTARLEKEIKSELLSNLKLDLVEIQEDISFMQTINEDCEKIKHFLKTQHVPSTEFYELVSVLRITPHFDPNMSGYGLLQSKGVEIISNDSLRNAISLLYERSYPYYSKYEEERLRFYALHMEPQLIKYFNREFAMDLEKRITGNFYISMEDYKQLKDDSSFYKLLSAISFENTMVKSRAERIELAILNLMDFLKNELYNKN